MAAALTATTTVRVPDCVPCYLYAAGFNFASGQVIRDVPYDPHLRHLFFGEEVSMAARLYTKGYDLVAPPETVCYHLWSRAHRPVFSLAENNSKMSFVQQRQRQASIKVVKNQVLGINDPSYLGLGTERTVAEWARLLKVDFETQQLYDGCEYGCLPPDAFSDIEASEMLAPPDSLEAKLYTLDAKALDRIAFFLTGQLNEDIRR